MFFWSQRDPQYANTKLGKSKLTVQGYGCFVCSLATLYQKQPKEILAILGGMTDSGLVVSGVIAQACGGAALPKTFTPPSGWCIAMTDHYAANGVATHFFIVNAEKKLQIDPLDFPAMPETLKYKIVEYRPFTNVKLNTQTWQEEVREWNELNGIITQGWEMPDAPMSQLRVGAALKSFKERFIA